MQDYNKLYDKLEIKYYHSNKIYSPENIGKSLMKDFRKQSSLNYSNSISDPIITKKSVTLKSY